MTIRILTLGAAFALAASAVAIAADDQPGPRGEERVVIVTGPGGPHGAMHGDMDADKDGIITRDEFRAMHDRMFGKLDKNGDGRISADEMKAHHGPGDVNVRIEGPGGHHGPGGMMWEERRGPGGPGSEDVRIVRHAGDGPGDLDVNKDGKVSFDEFTKPMREHFDAADKNRNGFLDKDEMEGRDHMFMFRRVERRE